MQRWHLFFKDILRFFKAHRKRVILATLGILFGIFSLVAVGNISLAMHQKVKTTLDKFGPNLLIIRAGEVRVTGHGVRQFGLSQSLKIGDAQAIKHLFSEVKEVVPVVETSFPLRYQQNTTVMKVVGATPNIFKVRNLKLKEGRFYGNKEEKYLARTVVLGAETEKQLFKGQLAFGQYILIWRVPCKVIGTLQPKGTDLAGENLDKVVYLPLNTMMRRFLNQDYLSAIYVQAQEGANLHRLKSEIRRLLRKRHGLGIMQKDDFSIYGLEDVIKTKQQGLKLVAVLSKMAAVISFAIGGLGIFAMMLLGVAERRQEIGIRRALGARKNDIIYQFLAESCLISFVGGVLGIAMGIFIAIIASLVASLPLVIDIRLIFEGLLISLGLGIGSGVYPAYVAANLMPLKALRG